MGHANEIARLAREELDAVEAQLAALEPLIKKKAALQAILQNAEALTQGAVPINGAPAPTAGVGALPPHDTGSTGGTGGGPTITFVATHVLKQHMRPMTAPEITRGLLDSGFKMNANNPVEVVRSTLLRRSDRFEKVDTGLYALTGWPDSVKQRREQEVAG